MNNPNINQQTLNFNTRFSSYNSNIEPYEKLDYLDIEDLTNMAGGMPSNKKKKEEIVKSGSSHKKTTAAPRQAPCRLAKKHE